jgi:pimeloyl-ACP methyl ester carboxylesterase
MADKLRASIPNATLVEIPASYHHLVLDNPSAFVHELDRFLTALP